MKLALFLSLFVFLSSCSDRMIPIQEKKIQDENLDVNIVFNPSSPELATVSETVNLLDSEGFSRSISIFYKNEFSATYRRKLKYS